MEGLIGLLILVISAIGWIANAMQEQKAKEQQQQRGGPQRPQRRLQEEIESFLKEIQPPEENQPQPAPQKKQQPERKPKQPPRESRRTQTRQEKRTGNTTTPRSSNTARPSANRPGSNPSPSIIQGTQPPSLLEVGLQPGEKTPWATAGQVEDRQLQDFMRSEAATGFSQDIRNLLSQDQLLALQALAQKHRGGGNTSGTALTVQQMLTSENIRQAFVVNEILKPPRSLR